MRVRVWVKCEAVVMHGCGCAICKCREQSIESLPRPRRTPVAELLDGDAVVDVFHQNAGDHVRTTAGSWFVCVCVGCV